MGWRTGGGCLSPALAIFASFGSPCFHTPTRRTEVIGTLLLFLGAGDSNSGFQALEAGFEPTLFAPGVYSQSALYDLHISQRWTACTEEHMC